MLIKVAVKRENNGTITWKDPYAASIRNRLQIDKNLSDVENKTEARNNLGIPGLLEKLESDLKSYIDSKYSSLRSYVDSADSELDARIKSLSDALTQTTVNLNNAIGDMKNYVDQSKQSTTDTIGNIVDGLERLPVGSILPFVGNTGSIPAGWAVCDGNNGTIDLRDWFLIGTSDSNRIGATGGEKEVTLNEGQMPRHHHLDPYCDNLEDGNMEAQIRDWRNQGFDVAVDQGTNNAGSDGTDYNAPRVYTGWAGGNQPHNNMPPYKYVMFIQKVSG